MCVCVCVCVYVAIGTVIRTAIGTKSAPPYACIFTDHIETELLKTQDIKSRLWKRFIDDIFSYGQKVKRA